MIDDSLMAPLLGPGLRFRPLRAIVVAALSAVAACGGGSSGDDPLAPYTEQILKWGECDAAAVAGNDAYILAAFDAMKAYTRCATMRAPLDYSNPAAGEIRIALSRVSQADPSKRLGTLMIHPGGPGDDGLSQPVVFGYIWNGLDPTYPKVESYRRIVETFDLIAWSPRGLGSSTPLLKCASDQLERFVTTVADRSPGNVQAMLDNGRLLAQACTTTRTGEPSITPYINSDATARDLEILRRVLREEKLNYYGMSYGTWLGSWYASLFPERVGRMLLIGNLDLRETTSFVDALFPIGGGQQWILDQILAPYATRHADRFRLGSTAAEVRGTFRSLPPLLHGVLVQNTTDSHFYQSTDADYLLLIFRAARVVADLLQQHPQADFAEISALLGGCKPEDKGPVGQYSSDRESNDFSHKNACGLSWLYFKQVARSQGKEPTAAIAKEGANAVTFAIMCNDTAFRHDRDTWVAKNDLDAAMNPYSGGNFTTTPCLAWGGPSAKKPPLANMAKASGVLMLQSEYDGQTTAPGALQSLSSLPNASMIYLTNEYAHVPRLPYGDRCVDEPLTRYLLDGTQPPRMTACPGAPLPQDRPSAP